MMGIIYNEDSKYKMENHPEIEQNSIEAYQKKTIRFSSHLLQHGTPKPLILILTILESLQLITIVLLQPLHYKSLGLDLFRQTFNFLYPDAWLRNSDAEQYLIPLFFMLGIMHLGFFGRALYKFCQGEKSRIKIIVHYFFLSCSVLTAPGFLISLTIFQCSPQNTYQQNSKCLQGYHIAQMFMAIIIIVWLFLANIFKIIFYINRNPFRFPYYTCSSNLWMIGSLVLKLAPAIFVIIDPKLEFNVLYIVSFAALNLGYLAFFRFFQPYYRSNQFCDQISLHSETITPIVITFFIPIYFLSGKYEQNCIFLSSWLIAIMISCYIVMYFKQKKEVLKKKIIEGKFDKEDSEDFVQFFYIFIEEVEKHFLNPQTRLILFDLAMIHRSRCSVLGCPCHHIVCKRMISQEGPTKKEVYNLLLCLLRQIFIALPALNELQKLEGFIEYERLECEARSIILFKRLENPKDGLLEKIETQRFFFQYQESNKQYTELVKYRQFSQNLWHFEEMVEVAAQKCQKYWRQLIQQDCEVTKIWKMAVKIVASKAKIQKFMRSKLLTLFPSNLYVQKIYLQICLFIYRVSVAEVKEQMLEFQKTLTAQSEPNQLAKRLTFRENCDLTVLCAYKQEDDFKFCNISSNISTLLKYQNTELLGKKISTIIPNCLKELHHEKLSSYLTRQDNEIREREDVVYLPQKDRSLICCSYFTKILPSLAYGLELVSFMKRVSQKAPCLYLMYYYQTICSMNAKKGEFGSGMVAEIDEGLKSMFSIEDEEQNNISIEQLIPEWCIHSEELFQEENSEGSNGIVGIEVVSRQTLKENLQVRTIRIIISENDSLGLSCNFFEINPTLKVDHSPKIEKKRNSFLGEISREQFTQLLRNNQDESVTALPLLTEAFESQAPQNRQDPSPFKKINLIILYFAFLSVMTLCMIFNFEETKKIAESADHDIEIIEISSESAQVFVLTAISFQKVTSNELSVLEIEEKIVQGLKEMIKHIERVYDVLGYKKIDRKIQLPLEIIGQDSRVRRKQTTLNKGTRQFEAEAKKFLKDQNLQSHFFIKKNWLHLFDQISTLVELGEKNFQEKKQSSVNILFILNALQFICLAAFCFFLFWRIKKANEFAQDTIQYYEKEITINSLMVYEKQCNEFIQRVKGKTMEEQISEEGIRGVLGELNKVVQPFERCGEEGEDEENTPINQQQWKNIKYTLSFQKIPSKRKLRFLVLVSLALFVGLKIGATYLMDVRFSGQTDNFPLFINEGHILERLLIKFLYFKEINEQLQFRSTIQELQGAVYNLGQNNYFSEEFSFGYLFQSLAEIYQKDFALIQYAELYESAVNFQQKIHQEMHKNYERVQIGKEAFLYVGIGLAILFFTILWKHVAFPVEFMIKGCIMMKKILGNPQNKLSTRILMVGAKSSCQEK